MLNYRRATLCGAAYFSTVNTYRCQPFSINPDVRSTLRAGIEQVRQTLPFDIDVWALYRITCIASGLCLRAMLICQPVGVTQRPYSSFHRYVREGNLASA